MKICHTQAMKQIKELEAQKKALIDFEDDNCVLSYKEGEAKTVSSYDYAKTRDEIEKLDARYAPYVALSRRQTAWSRWTALT